MFGNIGFGELLLIGLIALLLFGPNKLPELGRSLGKTIREFKQGARDLLGDEQETPRERKDVTPPEPPPAPAPAQAQTAQKPGEAEQGASQPQTDRQDSRRLPD
ncbi:twin-arginine translocase TatA/TatE family subunit [Paenibacillus allorhizosphaerae]|uniref:Sec-independent protein translocase protein TatA n=1 Tax=Paenibacillus allorhizosphaerae TaxID=2849866 RepID=A0ABN7U0K5_9BACL|nr:twin-arginine translocase TatA/TatE family subunit [Paenibacillus allorhizosphaerae]CAG7657797.1 Sec-independent protein translocase protein TatA [Paenibacillus allorhizosphaerae]